MVKLRSLLTCRLLHHVLQELRVWFELQEWTRLVGVASARRYWALSVCDCLLRDDNCFLRQWRLMLRGFYSFGLRLRAVLSFPWGFGFLSIFLLDGTSIADPEVIRLLRFSSLLRILLGHGTAAYVLEFDGFAPLIRPFRSACPSQSRLPSDSLETSADLRWLGLPFLHWSSVPFQRGLPLEHLQRPRVVFSLVKVCP